MSSFEGYSAVALHEELDQIEEATDLQLTQPHRLSSLILVTSEVLRKSALDEDFFQLDQKKTILEAAERCFSLVKPYHILLAINLNDFPYRMIIDAIKTTLALIEEHFSPWLVVNNLAREGERVTLGIATTEEITKFYVKLAIFNIKTYLKEAKFMLFKYKREHEEESEEEGERTFYDTFLLRFEIFHGRTELQKETCYKSIDPRFLEYEGSVHPSINSHFGEDINDERLFAVVEAEVFLDNHRQETEPRNSHFAFRQFTESFSIMINFCLNINKYSDIKNFSESDRVSQRILDCLDSFLSLIQKTSVLPMLVESDNVVAVRANLYNLKGALKWLIRQRTSSGVLAGKLKELEYASTCIIGLFLRQNSDFPETRERTVLYVPRESSFDQHLSRESIAARFDFHAYRNGGEFYFNTLMEADKLPEKSIKVWKAKFASVDNMDDILANTQQEMCPICLTSFQELLSSVVLAVVPDCDHVTCLPCMEQNAKTSPSM